MAEYSIILNISGNAIAQTAKLEKHLTAAEAKAASLSATMRGVTQTSNGMSVLRSQLSGVNTQLRDVERNAKRALTQLNRVKRKGIPYTPVAGTRARQRTGGAERFMNYGTTFSLGGFSSTFSTILKPDENGMLFGLDATKLISKVNYAAIAGNIMGAIGKALLKITAVSTAAMPAMGALGLAKMTQLLMSEGMAQGVRIIQRRNQARAGLGEAYLEAQNAADMLAANYGLERSVAISSLNVLTGMKVGSQGQRLSIKDATALTRIGGLVSQQAGVPFERVMTNLQQLMAQTNPNIRDIRELLNQAPILGRYAIEEMERRGIEGVDKNTYLKDQANLLSVATRYDIENSSSPIMQARGMVSVAQQDFWSTLASNEDWSWTGAKAAQTIRLIADALSDLISALSKDVNFQNAVNQVTLLLTWLSTNTDWLTRGITGLVKDVGDTFNINLGDIRGKAKKQTQAEATISNVFTKPEFKDPLFERAKAAGLFRSTDDSGKRREFEVALQMFAAKAANNHEYKKAISYINVPDMSSYSIPAPYTTVPIPTNRRPYHNEYSASAMPTATSYMFEPDWQKHGRSFYSQASVPSEKLITQLGNDFLESLKSMTASLSKITPNGGTTDNSSDVSGYTKDKRNLEIHFHDKLVEWNSTIESNDPQVVVNTIAQDMEQLVSASVQKALLGATGKMASRWQ